MKILNGTFVLAVTFSRLLRGKLLISLRRSRRLSAMISEVDLNNLSKVTAARTSRSILTRNGKGSKNLFSHPLDLGMWGKRSEGMIEDY